MMLGFGKRSGRTAINTHPQDSILGKLGEAKVTTAIGYRRPGRVYYRATWWKAECHQQGMVFEPGTWVQVVKRDVTILIVEPCWDS